MSLLTAAKARSPVSRAGVRPQRAGLGRGGCASVLCDLPSSPSAQIAPETCLRHTWLRGHGFLSILFIRMSLFASVQFHLVKVFMSFPIALPKRWCYLRGSCSSLFSVLTKGRGWVDLSVRNCYSSLLFQVLGYTPDFVSTAMAPYINDIHRKGVRVISNAGGINPLACAAALQEVAKKAGVDLKIAVVAGDDLMSEKENLKGAGITDLESGKQFPENIHSMNVYLGARPISRALDLGADIVVTGRCVDSGIVLGPLIHSFGWNRDDYDLLAAGSLAGHLIECGAQCTGGIFTDWHTVPDWHNIGFPIVECSSEGDFILSKPPDTGGLISFGTVAEQLVYELGNPQRYLLPDVTCDFSQVSITEIPGFDGGAVKVCGAKGLPPSTFYKVNATYLDGFRATAVCPVGGPKAVQKAKRTAEAILQRTRLIFSQRGYEDYSAVNIQVLGSEDTYGPHARRSIDGGPREAVIWLAVHHKQREAVEIFSKEIAPAGTGMAPGLTGIVGGRPRVSPVLKPFFFYYPKSNVQINLFLNGQHVEIFEEDLTFTSDEVVSFDLPKISSELKDLPSGPHTYRLEDLAYTRSGDKGNSANIDESVWCSKLSMN
uniref:Acyclic terpene utilisation N-terminal domain-containing protein n=1 Tax=Serinus canaria TaxID=9135 RepID=A0A8C9UF61_SERCA